MQVGHIKTNDGEEQQSTVTEQDGSASELGEFDQAAEMHSEYEAAAELDEFDQAAEMGAGAELTETEAEFGEFDQAAAEIEADQAEVANENYLLPAPEGELSNQANWVRNF